MNNLFILSFQTEKWIEAETLDNNSKIYTKLSFSIHKVPTDNKVKTPAKINNFIDSAKSYETSPRMNYINLKTSSLSNQPMVTTLDESDSEPLSSYRKRSSTNNVLAKPPSNNPVREYFVFKKAHYFSKARAIFKGFYDKPYFIQVP